MTNNNDHRGKIVYRNDLAIGLITGVWERYLMPQIEKIIKAYSALGIGPCTTEVYREIIEYGTAMVTARFEEKVAAAVKKIDNGLVRGLVGSSISPQVDERTKSLKDAIAELHRLKEQQQNGPHSIYRIDLSDCYIERSGKPVLDTKRITKRYQVEINSEIRNQLLTSLTELAEKASAAKSFLKELGLDRFMVLGNSNTAFLYEDEDGVHIDFQLFGNLP